MTNPVMRGARQLKPIHRLGHAVSAALAAAVLAGAVMVATAAIPTPVMAAIDSLRLVFAPTQTTIPDGQRTPLAVLADLVRDTPSARVQVTAFAAAADKTYARRLSLSRGLAVRAFLIDSGMSADRIHLRALGPDTDRGPRDRVDVVIIRQ